MYIYIYIYITIFFFLLLLLQKLKNTVIIGVFLFAKGVSEVSVACQGCLGLVLFRASFLDFGKGVRGIRVWFGV